MFNVLMKIAMRLLPSIGIKDSNEVKFSAITFYLELSLEKDWLK